ncbi:protein phosphatase PrpC [Oscillibacter valericigenes Sjm18-20]|nr:protein phosphatase PrpC [Oscillibacter valericigenes Sjm18-20]
MQVWGITDVGLVRKDNQDAFAMRERTDSGHTVCVVCDGMGGTAGGKQASHIAVDTYMRELEKVLTPEMSPQQLREASSFAVSLANRVVREAAQRSEEYRNMGTTLVAAVSYGGGAVVSNVGDSRAYHITPTSIVRVTRDHSLVESMVERGDITAEEARCHPNRNLITRALGPDAMIECDGYICPMEPGEFLLLCSDGLVDTVTDQEMLNEVNRAETGEACLARLLEISKSRGAKDNVTAVLMRKDDEKEAV